MSENKVVRGTDEKLKPRPVFKVIKRIIDIIGSLVGLVLILICYIFIKVAFLFSGDADRVIFKQTRIGKDGKEIHIHKFRSMVVNAEEELQKILDSDPEKAAEYKRFKKLKDDPRITPVGRFIRRYSIDEVPQFYDVLIGQLSLVGPRPYLPAEKKDMGNYYNIIIKVKPGITGFWQVNGRSNTDFETRLKYDKYYCRHRDLIMDFGIVFKTLYKVFKKEGAE